MDSTSRFEPSRDISGSSLADSRTTSTRVRRIVRTIPMVASIALILVGGGCATFKWWPKAGFIQQTRRIPANVSLSELVDELNQNITAVSAWRSDEVKIRAKQKGSLPVSLGANIAVQRPRNFRLVASKLGKTQVDLGSNYRDYWVWSSQMPGNQIFTASHEQPSHYQQQLPIPFEPDWIMEALGVVPLQISELKMKQSDIDSRTVTLVSNRQSPQGKQVQRVIVVDVYSALIIEQSLYDSNGLIARATFENHKKDERTGIVLPHRIELSWPQAEVNLSMTIGEIEVNPTEIPDAVWQPQRQSGYVR